MNEEQIKLIRSLKNYLNTPIAQRVGVHISPEDCKIWVEELEKCLDQNENKEGR